MAKSGFFNPDATPQEPSTKSSFFPGGAQDVEQVDGSFYETDDAYVEVTTVDAVGDLVGQAQAAADAAASSETAAASSETNAAASAVAADASANAAALSETNAAASAVAADASADAAALSETNAAASAVAADASADAAALSETNAAASAVAADASANAAALSETNAAASAVAADASANAAALSETNAAASAAAADADRIAAQAAAAAAATSETNAANSASAAAGSAGSASTSATNASNSASAAASSETNAAASALAADASADAAASSASDAAQSAIDAAAAVSGVATFDPELSVIYVAKTGDDAETGRVRPLPKLTLASALTAAAALISGGAPKAVVRVLDAGVYTENVTLSANVVLDAKDATLVGTLTFDVGSSAFLHHHYSNGSGQRVVEAITTSGETSHYQTNILDGRGLAGTDTNNQCIRNGTAGRVIMASVGQMFVPQDGEGVRDGTAGGGFGHVHFFIRDLYLAGNNAKGLTTNNATTWLVGYIEHILEVGTPTGTVGINLNDAGSTVSVVSAEISADTAYNIAAGSLYLTCPKVSGARTGTPVNVGGWSPSAADRFLYSSSAGVTSEGTITPYGRTLAALADAAALAAQVDAYFLTPAEGAAVFQPLDSDLTALAALTTASFGRSLLETTSQANARSVLGVDPAGTDNSTNVTLAGTPDYITISGQVITRGPIDLATDVTGDLPVSDGGTGASDAANARTNLGLANANTVDIIFVIDGGGATITTGVKGYIPVDFPCTINQVTLLADQSGSIVVDILKDTYANYPPAGSIAASAKPTISSATKSQDSTLSGWTTSISAGDILGFKVDSITTCQRVTVALKVTKT